MTQSDEMILARRCFEGPKNWSGEVHGAFGLISRTFGIVSEGRFENGVLTFSERMNFSDGATIERSWELRQTPAGLLIEADGIQSLKPGVVRTGALHLEYAVSFGGVRCRYTDVFRPGEDGQVENTGCARILGVPALRIHALAVAPVSSERPDPAHERQLFRQMRRTSA